MSQGKPIRIMVVDDHAVVRSGLKAFLMVFDDLELVGEASSGQEAIQLAERAQPDVILMDIIMPDLDGPATTKAIRSGWPNVQVVALTSFREDELVKRALQAGAIGYLLKNVGADELADAIRSAHAGRAPPRRSAQPRPRSRSMISCHSPPSWYLVGARFILVARHDAVRTKLDLAATGIRRPGAD